MERFYEKYLRCMQVENAFCVCFAPQDIHHLLCGLTQDYRSVPLNIFEPVLLSALELVIRERSPKLLDLSQDDISFLYQRFSAQSENNVQECLKNALSQLSEEKIAFILNGVHSLADLLDILSDTELCADHFDLLINMLPLSVFAMLLSQYSNDDFLDRKSEQLLFAALQKRKQQLSTFGKQQIEQMINALQHEKM